jgi:quercetin dioxygenase-like cupin family protein
MIKGGIMQPEKIHSHVALAAPIVMPGPSAEFDFAKELEELRKSPEWESGIAKKALILYPDLQVTLRRMKPNMRIPEHHNPGRICVQTIFGHIRMHADDKLFDLPQGKMLVLDRAVTHDVEAVEESAFLLTVANPEHGGR